MAVTIEDEEKQIIEGISEILSQYDKDKSRLIPILQKVQQAFGICLQ